MDVDINIIKRNLEELSAIGRDQEGKLHRAAFSEQEFRAQQWLMSKLRQLGINCYRDRVGNIIADYPGDNPEYVCVGSHLDTVPDGGMLDGALGVVSGLECLRVLAQTQRKFNRGLRLIAFTAEEGSAVGGTFGSRCYSGQITNVEKLDLSSASLTIDDVKAAQVDKEELFSYLELHIEQGAVLDINRESIGIVDGIVGIVRYQVEVSGTANHAGTTPMDVRDDALIKACQMILRFNQLVNEQQHRLVGTVGKLSILPNAVNVIPGKADFTIEMRSMDLRIIDQVGSCLRSEFSDCQVIEIIKKDSVRLSRPIIKIIENETRARGVKYRVMSSGAGHDASPMSRVTPAGMIFVPSVNGISHAPNEKTKWPDIEKGASILLSTIIKLIDSE